MHISVKRTFREEYSCARVFLQALCQSVLQNAGCQQRDEAEVFEQYGLQVQWTSMQHESC